MAAFKWVPSRLPAGYLKPDCAQEAPTVTLTVKFRDDRRRGWMPTQWGTRSPEVPRFPLRRPTCSTTHPVIVGLLWIQAPIQGRRAGDYTTGDPIWRWGMHRRRSGPGFFSGKCLHSSRRHLPRLVPVGLPATPGYTIHIHLKRGRPARRGTQGRRYEVARSPAHSVDVSLSTSS